MTQTRWRPGGTLLEKGTVLVVGGWDQRGEMSGRTASAEVWDPSTGFCSEIESTLEPRGYSQVVPLTDGRVLVAGGIRNTVSYTDWQ